MLKRLANGMGKTFLEEGRSPEGRPASRQSSLGSLFLRSISSTLLPGSSPESQRTVCSALPTATLCLVPSFFIRGLDLELGEVATETGPLGCGTVLLPL